MTMSKPREQGERDVEVSMDECRRHKWYGDKAGTFCPDCEHEAAETATRPFQNKAPPRPELEALAKRAAERMAAMSPVDRAIDELRQRRSWVIGELMLEHPDMTREAALARYRGIPDGAVLEALERLQEASFQAECVRWAIHTFGDGVVRDTGLRALRFMEEAAELTQATGLSRLDAHRMVDYAYNRQPGQPAQEVGGVMVTLAVLCGVWAIDLDEAADAEIKRCWTKVDAIRARQAEKPRPTTKDVS